MSGFEQDPLKVESMTRTLSKLTDMYPDGDPDVLLATANEFEAIRGAKKRLQDLGIVSDVTFVASMTDGQFLEITFEK